MTSSGYKNWPALTTHITEQQRFNNEYIYPAHKNYSCIILINVNETYLIQNYYQSPRLGFFPETDYLIPYLLSTSKAY